MTTLPPLPRPDYPAVRLGTTGQLAYTAKQMTAYGQACRQAELDEAKNLISTLWIDIVAASSLVPKDCGAYKLLNESIESNRDDWLRITK